MSGKVHTIPGGPSHNAFRRSVALACGTPAGDQIVLCGPPYVPLADRDPRGRAWAARCRRLADAKTLFVFDRRAPVSYTHLTLPTKA